MKNSNFSSGKNGDQQGALPIKIEKANRTDANEITELTIRSKDYWNYGAKQIEEWREEMTISPKYIDENQVVKIFNKEKLIGFYAYQPKSAQEVKLNFFFIEPDFIGQGYGQILMTDFIKRMKSDRVERVTVDSDPNAEKFYERYEFIVIGKMKTAIENRFLPIMELKIKY